MTINEAIVKIYKNLELIGSDLDLENEKMQLWNTLIEQMLLKKLKIYSSMYLIIIMI